MKALEFQIPTLDPEVEERANADAERRRLEERRERWQSVKGGLLGRGMSLRHLEALWAGKIDDTPAMRAVRDAEPDTLVLSGNVGCGKTLAAHAWLLDADLVDGWHPGGKRMVTAASFARMSRYQSGKFDELAEPSRLVLDDMGVEFADKGGSYLVDFDELLDLRWRSKKATLITTNLKLEEFRKRYGDRVFDRVAGDGSWFNVPHPSMRRVGR